MEKKAYLKVTDIKAYQSAFALSNEVWEIVIKWKIFEKDTLGKQFVRAIDSISANIAEGFGRHHKNDKIKFYIIARGSLLECMDWIEKAKTRNLVDNQQYENITTVLRNLPKQINSLIKQTRENLSE
jgi:four helix bundle protein